MSAERGPKRPGWWFDELAHAGVENLDPAHVAVYDRKQDVAAPFDVEAEIDVLRRHGLDPDAVVVDLGAGTGRFAIAVAGMCSRVVAVDVSPAMVRQLRSNLAASGRDNVEVVEAGFLGYEHDGPPADVVCSRWALHHLPDAWKAIALVRMKGMLRPNGLLRLSDVAFGFAPDELEERIERWRASLPQDAPADAWRRSDLDDHLREEHSTFTWILEPIIERAGFEIVERRTADDGLVAEYVARAGG